MWSRNLTGGLRQQPIRCGENNRGGSASSLLSVYFPTLTYVTSSVWWDHQYKWLALLHRVAGFSCGDRVGAQSRATVGKCFDVHPGRDPRVDLEHKYISQLGWGYLGVFPEEREVNGLPSKPISLKTKLLRSYLNILSVHEVPHNGFLVNLFQVVTLSKSKPSELRKVYTVVFSLTF